MTISTSEEWIVLIFLVFVRLGTFFLFAPIFNFIKLPVNIRILFSVVLAFCLVQSLPFPEFSVNTLSFMGMIANEVINGAALSFGMLVAFAVFHFAGRIMDFQMGFGVAGLIDPATQIQAPMLGTVFNLLAIILFILSGGMVLVIKTLSLSLSAVPPGTLVNLQTPYWFIHHASLIFTLSISMVAPVMVVIFSLDLLMAFAGRMMPQMNVFIISIPIKIALGLVVLAATSVYASPLYRRVFTSIFEFWGPLIHG